MAYRFEKNGESLDLVLDGLENGIADSPEAGIGDLRNVNIISVPGEGSVGFAPTAIALPPTVTALAFTVEVTDIFTVASTSGWYNGMAIFLPTLVNGTGLAVDTVYYVGDLTSTTFKVYPTFALLTPVNVTLAGSGTITSYTFGTPAYKATNPINRQSFILDTAGRLWLFDITQGQTVLIFAGNLTIGTAYGLAIFKGYAFVFRQAAVDYCKLSVLSSTSPLSAWGYAWGGVTVAAASLPDFDHAALASQDDALYFCNASSGVGSILENAGATFDPTNSATYTGNSSALSIPTTDRATSLGELGINLLVGGLQNFVYPWDRVSTSYNYPIVLAEANTRRIVTSNSNAYLFTGNRGRIYITNGSNVDLYKKIPDSLSGTIDPYYTWGDANYWKNQLYFSFTASTNAGVALSSTGGVWAIDVATEALRYAILPSFGTYAGSTPVIVPNIVTSTPGGTGLYIGWVNGSSIGGIDLTSSTPYTNYQAYIEHDLVPVGTFYDVKTFEQIEFKLSKPLVSGEAVRLSWRGNLTDSFTTITDATFTTAGVLSGGVPVSFEKTQWLQIKTELSSTASSPSFTRLKEIRLR